VHNSVLFYAAHFSLKPLSFYGFWLLFSEKRVFHRKKLQMPLFNVLCGKSRGTEYFRLFLSKIGATAFSFLRFT
jgi:hypothetical protein